MLNANSNRFNINANDNISNNRPAREWPIIMQYLAKAKINLQLCSLYREHGFDYKISFSTGVFHRWFLVSLNLCGK